MPKLTLVLDRKPVQVYELDQPIIRIGRGETSDVLIDNVSVSRRHAELREEGGAWLLRDLGSSNGTFLNGQRVTAELPLRPGDEIPFGKFSLLFERVLAEPLGVEAGAIPAAAETGVTLHLPSRGGGAAAPGGRPAPPRPAPVGGRRPARHALPGGRGRPGGADAAL